MAIKIKLFILFLSVLCLSSYASYPRAGYEANLETIYHGVSGKVTIVDANTVLVENFNYDGGGIVVYFYLGTENTDSAFLNGLAIGPELTGPVYDGNEMIIHLPGPNTIDDYNAVSVWCVDATVSFGSGTFVDTTPVLSWTFDNLTTQSYVLDSFEPNDVLFGEIDAEDPNLLLHLNKRYQVTILNYAVHPFEVIAKDPNSADDIVLLSMNTDSGLPFESDEFVNWVDDGQGTAAFTLTQALYDAMTVPGKIPGYRCGIHSSNMRGNFDVCLSPPTGDLDGDCETTFFDFALFAGSWLESNIGP